jgi:hypothetical protein
MKQRKRIYYNAQQRGIISRTTSTICDLLGAPDTVNIELSVPKFKTTGHSG